MLQIAGAPTWPSIWGFSQKGPKLEIEPVKRKRRSRGFRKCKNEEGLPGGMEMGMNPSSTLERKGGEEGKWRRKEMGKKKRKEG